MGLGRFLGKAITFMYGIAQSRENEKPGLLFGSNKATFIGSVDVEGDVTATTVAGNAVNALAVKIGAAGTNLTQAWAMTYTWSVPALSGIIGSLSGIGIADVAMSGIAVGDVLMMKPVASIHSDITYEAWCLSAGTVQVKAMYIGSTGAVTAGATPFRIVAIRI